MKIFSVPRMLARHVARIMKHVEAREFVKSPLFFARIGILGRGLIQPMPNFFSPLSESHEEIPRISSCHPNEQ